MSDFWNADGGVRFRPQKVDALEGRTARPEPGVVLTAEEAAEFLVRSACEYDAEQCEDRPCEVCDGFRHLWYDVYRALSAAGRLWVEETLSALDAPTPQPRQGSI